MGITSRPAYFAHFNDDVSAAIDDAIEIHVLRAGDLLRTVDLTTGGQGARVAAGEGT